MTDGSAPKKLSLVVASPVFEKVHYAFVMATGAAAIGMPVTMFFTMGACPAVLQSPGWRDLASEKAGMTASTRDAAFCENGVAGMEELIESAIALDVRFMICEMGLRAENLENAPVLDGVTIQSGGVVTFLNDADGEGSIVFI